MVDDGCCETVLTGANLSRSTVVFFKHNDMQDLEDVLSAIAEDDVRHKRKAIEQRRFIIAEGLYRNSGNICPLPALLRIKEKYFYRLILDETLSFGSLGKTGRGLTEYFDVPVDSVEILIVSMDTSLGSVGGLCVGRRDIVEHQRLSGAGYCFSASAPPFLSAAAVQALSQMEKAPELLKSLQENAVLLWNGIRNIHGLRVLGTIPAPVIHVAFDQQIVTVPLKREIAMICALSQKLLLAGIGASTSKFSILRSDSKNAQQPTIRVCSRATLSTEEVARVLDAIRGVTKALLREEGFTFPPTPTR